MRPLSSWGTRDSKSEIVLRPGFQLSTRFISNPYWQDEIAELKAKLAGMEARSAKDGMELEAGS